MNTKNAYVGSSMHPAASVVPAWLAARTITRSVVTFVTPSPGLRPPSPKGRGAGGEGAIGEERHPCHINHAALYSALLMAALVLSNCGGETNAQKEQAAAATDRAESYESMAQEERTEAAEHQARQEDQL